MPNSSSPITAALKPIELISPELARQCIGYVYDGSNPEVLLSWNQNKDQDLWALLLNPGMVGQHRWIPEQVRTRLKKIHLSDNSVRLARHRFYNNKPSLDQLIRMGRLLAALSVTVHRTNSLCPDWLVVLVNDVVSNRVGTGVKSLADWTPYRLEELLRHDDPAATAVTATVITAIFNSEWDSSKRLVASAIPQLDEYLEQRGSGLTAAELSALSVHGKVGFIEQVTEQPATLTVCCPAIAGFSVDTAKQVRQAAISALHQLSGDAQQTAVLEVLTTTAPSRGADLVSYLGGTDWGLSLLNEAVARGSKVAPAVAKMNQRQQALDSMATDEAELVLPDYQPLPGRDDAKAKAQMRAWLDKLATPPSNHSNEWAIRLSKQARSITDKDIDTLLAIANDTARPGTKSKIVTSFNPWTLNSEVPALSLAQMLRLYFAHSDRRDLAWLARPHVAEGTDLRAVSDVCAELEMPDSWVERLAPEVGYPSSWPWFAQRPELIAKRLTDSSDITPTLRLLAEFPRVPAEFVPRIAAIALGDSKANRPLAQDLLGKHPAARSLAEQGLLDGKTEVRIAAAGWLARIGDPDAIAAISARLGTEKAETARAALLTALETVGGDIGAYLGPGALLAEATKGLKAKPPKTMGWFLELSLPALRWADGTAVDPLIPRWWAILATKMKNPDGSGLLDRYLSLLAPDDAALFGSFVLRAWIAYDTRNPDPGESRDYAQSAAAQRYQGAQEWLARARDGGNGQWLEYAERAAAISLEQHYADSYREHQSRYLGSAAAEKGLLGLTTRMPGIELANAVASYIRTDGSRRAQVEYLVYALYANGDPAAIQLLLSIARRHKQAGVQAKAAELVERLAEDRGWSADELADRTIPTAGFSEDRLLRLDFGPREFLGRITDKATIELADPAGKPIKALPKPRQDDDAELAAAAKKQLTTSRKELKAVLATQTGRLNEAMCAQRTWSTSDWQQFLAGHPLIAGLIPRLVWLEECNGQSRSFRPVDDGTLIDAHDDPIELAADARIGLAHSALLTADDVAAWQQHLDDYEVTPLFSQFSSTTPQFSPGTTEFTDLAGHVTDTFTFRNVATKRGYTRGDPEDGGWFSDYTKQFPGLNLVAAIEFTGSSVPEENIACATEQLHFRRGRRKVALDQVPAILLAECYADYAALAALGPFDPNYRKIGF